MSIRIKLNNGFHIVKKLENYNSDEIRALCTDASMYSLFEVIRSNIL